MQRLKVIIKLLWIMPFSLFGLSTDYESALLNAINSSDLDTTKQLIDQIQQASSPAVAQKYFQEGLTLAQKIVNKNQEQASVDANKMTLTKLVIGCIAFTTGIIVSIRCWPNNTFKNLIKSFSYKEQHMPAGNEEEPFRYTYNDWHEVLAETQKKAFNTRDEKDKRIAQSLAAFTLKNNVEHSKERFTDIKKYATSAFLLAGTAFVGSVFIKESIYWIERYIAFKNADQITQLLEAALKKDQNV